MVQKLPLSGASRRALVVASLLGVTACGPKASSGSSDARSLPRVQAFDPSGMNGVEVDLNEDGKPDVVNYYAPSAPDRVAAKAYDLNLDGRIDMVSHFDPSGALVRETMDGDFDGRFDLVDLYAGGQRTESHVDTNYDGVYDAFSYFEGGRLVKKARDTTGDGTIDFWERYDADGNVIDDLPVTSEDPATAEASEPTE